MWDIYEQPWALVGLAVITLFVVFTIRSVIPEKRHWWQLLIPVLIAAAAFGLDHFVQTDKEKIEVILDAGMQAVENENFNDVYSFLSDDYSDSLHSSKQKLIDFTQRKLDTNIVEKCKKTDSLITLSQNNTKAKVNLFMLITLGKDSPVAQVYSVPLFKLKVDVDFVKKNDNWLIDCIELKSVNKQNAKWTDVR